MLFFASDNDRVEPIAVDSIVLPAFVMSLAAAAITSPAKVGAKALRCLTL
jgi:hypothetical protein